MTSSGHRAAAQSATTQESFAGRPLSPARDLSAFAVDAGNELAVEAAARVATNEQPRLNPVWLTGQRGVGKSHLLNAAALIAREAGHETLLLAGGDLAELYAAAREQGALLGLWRWLYSAELMIIDDVDRLPEDRRFVAPFLDYLAEMPASGRRLLLSSETVPVRLEIYSVVARQHRGGAVFAGMAPPGLEARAEFARRLAAPQRLGPGVISLLCERAHGDLDALAEGARALATHERDPESPLDVAHARTVLDEALPEPQTDLRTAAAASATSANLAAIAPRFRSMLADADSDREQLLALQIAVGERLRQVRVSGGSAADEAPLLTLLASLRAGDAAGVREAVKTFAADETAPA